MAVSERDSATRKNRRLTSWFATRSTQRNSKQSRHVHSTERSGNRASTPCDCEEKSHAPPVRLQMSALRRLTFTGLTTNAMTTLLESYVVRMVESNRTNLAETSIFRVPSVSGLQLAGPEGLLSLFFFPLLFNLSGGFGKIHHGAVCGRQQFLIIRRPLAAKTLAEQKGCT